MKKIVFICLASVVFYGCNDNTDDGSVISTQYIHKYGYAVSEQDWNTHQYPGQIITTLDNGVTVTINMENGVRHGPATQTFPHSQMIENYSLYSRGNKIKEMTYDLSGFPIKEWIQLSPTRHSVTAWYKNSSPMYVEEFIGEELLEGQYFTLLNELESRVDKGDGLRILRDPNGVLLAKEEIQGGYALKKETFYPSGIPESIAYYYHDTLNGEKRTFAQTGEPLAIEEWVAGRLHGFSSYFKNGNLYLEIPYQHGLKHGIEKHYIDAEIVSQEVPWVYDKKHGEAVVYVNHKPESHWFYEGQAVSKRKFDELNRVDEVISQLHYRQEGKAQAR